MNLQILNRSINYGPYYMEFYFIFQNQCNKYTQGISQLARTGLIGQRALTILGWVFCMTGLISKFPDPSSVFISGPTFCRVST